MVTSNVGELNVDIVARLGRLESGFKKAEARALVAGKRIDKAVVGTGGTGGIGGIGKAAIRAFSSFSLLEGGLKGVDAVTEAISGNWEESAKIVKTLPLGIGQVATGIDNLLRKHTPWGKELLEINRQFEKINRSAENLQKLGTRRASERNQAREELQGIRSESRLIGLDGLDREFKDAELQSIDRIKELTSRLGISLDPEAKSFIQRSISQEQINQIQRRQDFLRRATAERAGLGAPRQINSRLEVSGVAGQTPAQKQTNQLDRIIQLMLGLKEDAKSIGTLN